MPPRKTLEEELLESLWEDPNATPEVPMLSASKVIQQSQTRPTYRELAASGNPISARIPAATVRLDTTESPLRGTAASVVSQALSATVGRGGTGRLSAGSLSATGRSTGSGAEGLLVSQQLDGSPSRSAAGPLPEGVLEVDAAVLRNEVDGVIQSVASRQKEYEEAVLAVGKARDLVDSMEQEIKALRDEELELVSAVPPAPERLRKVRMWQEQRSAALAAQKSVVEVVSLEAATAEANLRAAEAELDFLADTRQALDATFAADESSRRDIMHALRGREERAAKGYLKRLQREAKVLEQLQQQQEELKEKKIIAAEDARAAAMERLTRGLERVKRNLAKGQELVEAQQAARRQAVLGLKDSLSKVREEVAKKATLYQQVQKQKREMREREFADLIEQGLNPYEVHRRKDLEAQAARQRAQLRARIEARQVEVATKLAKEEEVYQKSLAAAEEERRVLAKFQKEQGRAAAEAKVDEYMVNHTVSGQAMLDPTGRLPVNPSDAVVAKTRDFGAGRSSQALLDKMTVKHPHVRPKDMLIPTKYRPDGEDDDDLDDDLSSEEGGGAKSRAYTERTHTTATWITHRSGDGGEGGRGDSAKGKGESGWNPFEPKPLSKLERTNLEAAKTRHKEALAAPKVMMGKEFAGDAFITTPAVVVFKDFEVGGTYSTRVTITNRSYAKNTYRVLEVSPEYGNVLEVSYQLPGHLATGVSGEVTITFTPKANEDIDTHINMLAETGPFQIPVQCLTKKALLSLSAPTVDFGPGVILGEQVTRHLTLSNDGALEVDYVISHEDDDVQGSDGSPAGPLSCPPFTVSPASGVVSGYGRVKLTVTFCPTVAQAVSKKLTVSYKSQTHRKLHVPSNNLELQGVGRDVPIYLERDVIDFKCVAVEHTYREKLVVRNGGKTAMKVSVTNKPDISDYIEFSPDFGFVQAGQAFPITILFKPRAAIMAQCARFRPDPDDNVLEVPFKVVVPDQKLPVCFTVRAHVTTTDLVFSPPELNFGPCVIAEDTGVVLKVTNPSALPQTFGFVGLPPAIRVMPNDGFGYILPGESVERIVSFQPPISGPQSLTITAKTLAGRSFTLPITAVGIQPSLSLSHNKIQFPATPLNDVRSCSVILRNNTSHTQAFEFGVPANSGLVFIPHVGDVPPAGSKRIQINFQPTPDDSALDSRPSQEEAAAEEAASASAAAAQQTAATTAAAKGKPGSKPTTPQTELAAAVAAAEEAQGDMGDMDDGFDLGDGPNDDPNAWYSWHNYSVPCFIRPPMSGGGAASSRPVSASGVMAAAPQGEAQVLHLNIITCAVHPDLVLRTEMPWVANKRCYELNFGPVPVGQRVTRTIDLFNQGNDNIPLSQEPLDHHQYFNVVAAWRTLATNARCRCLIAFQPQERAEYMQMLTIISPRTHVRIALKGQGIAPQLKLEPPSVLTEGLDLGDVAKGETSEAKFSITNVCPFPLSWAAKFRGLRDPNLQNRAPFFCRPAEGTLAQGQSCEVVVVFRPSQQRPYYLDSLQVYVPNQQEQLNVPLKGRGWEEGLYLAGPEYPPPSEDPFLERQLADLANAALQNQAAQGTGSVPSTPPVGQRPPTEPAPPRSSTPLPLANPTPTRIGPPGAPSPILQPPLGVVPMAPGPSGPRTLLATFPHAMYLGETASFTMEVGSLKSSVTGAAAGELTLEGLTPAAIAAGWQIDTLKVPVPAGDKKTITISYKAPAEPNAGMAGLFGHSEYMELGLSALMTGGAPPPPPEGRRFTLTARVLLHPRQRPSNEPLPAGYKAVPTGEEEEVPFGDKKAGKKK